MQPSKPGKNRATRTVAIDFGMVRLGIAVSDEQKIIATPLMTLVAEKKTEETVQKLINEVKKHQQIYRYDIDTIVLGLPLMMSGKLGLLADEVMHFIDELKKIVDVPIVTWDERLTSVQADRSMRESNMTRRQRAKRSDTVAAVIILQNYLDHKCIRNQGIGN